MISTSTSTTKTSSSNRSLSDVMTSTLTPKNSSRHIFHFLSKLHHGILHFPSRSNNNNNNATSAKDTDVLNDDDKGHYARFVFVPMGYMNRHEQSMWRILNALEITQLPPLLITVGSSIIESSSSTGHTTSTDSNLFHQLLLEETIDLCTNVGGWIIPDRPWNYDGCASSIMDTIISYQEKRIQQQRELNYEEQKNELNGINESQNQEQSIVQDVISIALLALDEQSLDPYESNIIQNACTHLNQKISGNMIPLTSTSIHNHHYHQHNHDPISIPIVTMDCNNNEDYNNNTDIKNVTQSSSTTSTIPPSAIPCSNMKHYIIFESNEEKKSFQQKLMELVPDILLLFDTTNNSSMFTDTTKQQIESSIYHGTPISIIGNNNNKEQSSSSVSHLIQMFHHIDNELEKQSKQQKTKQEQQSNNTDIIEEINIAIIDKKDQNHHHVKNYGSNRVLTTSIQPLDNTNTNLLGNDSDMINELIKNWPIEYRKEKIVIANNSFLENNNNNNNNNNGNINSTINKYLNEYREHLLIAIECSYSPSYDSVPPPTENNSRDIQQPIEETTSIESHLHQMTTIVIEKECQYCNSCLQLLKRIMIWKKIQTITIQVLLVLFTFLTVLCAVLYSKIYSNSSQAVGLTNENDFTLPSIETNMTENDLINGSTLPIPDFSSLVKNYINHIKIVIMEKITNLDPIQMIIYISTICLPFIVSYFQKQNRHDVERSHDSSMKSWYRLEIAVIKMESELIQFRAQIGTYISYTIQSQEKLLLSENNSYINNNKENYIMDIADIAAVGKKYWGTLMMETNHIWSDVHDLITEEDKRNLLQTLSRYNDEIVVSSPQKKTNDNDNDTTSTTIDDSDTGDSKKIIQVMIGETKIHNDINTEKVVVSSSPDEMTPLLLPAIGFYMEKPIKQMNEPIPNDEKPTEVIRNPLEWEKRQYVKDFFFDYPKYKAFDDEAIESFYIVQDKVVVVVDSHNEKMKSSKPINTTIPPPVDSTVLIPVYYQPTTAEEYITTRLEEQLLQRSNDITSMDNNNNFVSKLMTYLTLSTTVLAALSYQWAIPIVLGLVTAFGMNQEFQRYDAKYHNTRNIVHNLEEMKDWWYNKLSEEERELSINKEKLITETEKIIVSYKCALHSEQS